MLRAALRPVSLAARAAAKPSVTARALSTSAVRFSGHAQPPFFGEGAKAGEVPTDDIQATGLERLQVLGEKEGVDVFDYKPLDSSRIGTFENPVKVFSWELERTIGCTGSPADSHELHWINLNTERTRRCPECGSVYTLDYHGDGAHAH